MCKTDLVNFIGLCVAFLGAIILACPLFASRKRLREHGLQTERLVAELIRASLYGIVGVVILAIGFALQAIALFIK